MFGFNRKTVLKAIHVLVQQHYSYESLINMSLWQISDIEKVIISLDQQETLQKAGF